MKIYSILSLSITIIIYLFVSFVKWDIEWITSISIWSEDERALILFLLVCKECLLCTFYNIGLKEYINKTIK